MADEYYIYTGGVVPRHVTRVRIDESVSVIPARAFHGHQNITELYCHIRVKKVEHFAFYLCPSLRIVIMPGVEVVERAAFWNCVALTDVQCGELKIIGECAFYNCESLRSIDLPSIKIVEGRAFFLCTHLTTVKFGKELESIRDRAFNGCPSLDRITLPLKDGMITHDNAFQGCGNLKHVDLIERAILSETIAALLLEEWRNDMFREIDAINQILPNTSAGDVYDDAGGKAQAIRTWIRSVLRIIVQYKAEHYNYLKEATITLELALPNDIVSRNVLPFLELPPYTFQAED
eukprot:scaffold3345_cov83-Skeletonema_dohrnii-CCMP3373.AAC.7